MEQLLNEMVQLTSQSLQDADCILEITVKLKEYIEGEDIESLNRAIGLRQIRIDQADAVNDIVEKRMKELHEQFSIKNLDDINQSRFPQVKSILSNKKQRRRIFRKIYDLEKVNQKNAELQLQEYKNKIKMLHKNKNVLNSYEAKPIGQSVLFNKIK